MASFWRWCSEPGARGLPVSVLAVMLLEEHGGVGGLARAGIGEARSARGRRHRQGGSPDGRGRARAPRRPGRGARHGGAHAHRAAVEAWARPRLATLDHEELWLLALDGHHGLRAARLVASGGIHGLHVAARDGLRIALREGASAFVLVHNHPSGDPAPSPEDVAFTRAVERAAAVVGTPLLDHVVIARSRATSMLEAGLLTGPR